jgi:hypothetical protein
MPISPEAILITLLCIGALLSDLRMVKVSKKDMSEIFRTHWR